MSDQKDPKPQPKRNEKPYNTKAGRNFDQIMRELDRNRQNPQQGK